MIRGSGIALFVYAGLMVLTFFGFAHTPTGFVPAQDKQYLVAFAQLPDAASLDRTENVMKRMSEIALKQPGVEAAIAFPGLSINGFTNSPNSGIVFVTLKPFDERKDPSMSAGAIAGALNGQYANIEEAYMAIFPPPPVQGLGTIGGFRLQIEDRGNLGYDELYKEVQNVIAKSHGVPELFGLFTSYTVNVPQWTRPSTAKRPRPTAWRSVTSSTPCRSTWARCMPTTSTASGAPIRSTCRLSNSSARTPTRSAS